MSFLRHRLRTQTALFPHQANRRYLIPNRANIVAIPLSSVTTTVVMTITMSADVEDVSSLGFSITVNAIAATVSSVVAGATPELIVVTFTPAGLSTQDVVVTYDAAAGVIKTVSSGLEIPDFVETATIP